MVTAAVPKGRFVWYELATTDPNKAQAFYRDVVGWGAVPYEGGIGPYTTWMNGENPVGGLMELTEPERKGGAPPHWRAYIQTPDVTATVERARQLGAHIIEPLIEVPGIGKMAFMTDPQGAMFAVFAPEDPAPGREGPPAAGEISWHELATTDTNAAFEFYKDIFGWELINDMDMGPLGVYRIYGQNDVQYGGMYNKPDDMPAPPHWLLYARVNGLDDAVERVKAHGGQILNGPMEVPGGDRIAMCMDPQGAAFALHEAKAAGA
jgi:hypothetical protein